jgi:hypothetical protein
MSRLPAIYRVSSLGRELSIKTSSHKVVLLLMALAGAAATAHMFASTLPMGRRVRYALTAVGTVFFGWAYVRELAPDDEAAAFIAVALGGAAWLVFGPSDLLPVAGALLFSRMVGRTVGPPAKLSDTVMAIAIVAGVTAGGGYIAIGMMALLGFALDATMKPAHRLHLVGAAVSLASVLYVARLGGVIHGGALSLTAIAAAAVPFTIVIALQPELVSKTDVGEGELDKRRVQAGMSVCLFATIAASVFATTIAEVTLLWAALGGVVIGRIVGVFRRR